ncbi:MAG TPA: hypothetical protein VJK54_07035, partial [Chthoniobacterales bacterium]|nr:hypothetical protein [Chthoniobacterales bacterium]
DSTTAYVNAYAYANVNAFASASASSSASEALQAACVADDMADDTKNFADLLSRQILIVTVRQHIDWSISAARETADFARAVAKYKTEK